MANCPSDRTNGNSFVCPSEAKLAESSPYSTQCTVNGFVAMEGNVKANHSRSIRPKTKLKVKSGCTTCKIRKVKCDEGRPSCHRCVSTGRTCNGYGVWGGGGNFYGQRQQSNIVVSKHSKVTPGTHISPSVLAGTAKEIGYFEWFRCRTAKKIQGAFISTFWDTLLFQASFNEPAVLHALLTLSSVHKAEIVEGNSQSRREDMLDEQEQFMLQHYTKAINHLQPHFTKNNKSSVRIALITCVVFVCLEFLRGKFRTAQTHLQSGLKVLGEMLGHSDVKDGGLLLLKPSRDPIDDFIAEALCRLHLQVLLWNQTYQHPSLVVLDYGATQPPTTIFYSFYGAWKQIERLLNRIFILANKGSGQRVSEPPEYLATLYAQQQRIQAELKQWVNVFEASAEFLRLEDNEGRGYQLLLTCHSMATIMGAVCLQSDDESSYDLHTQKFVSLIDLSVGLWSKASARPQTRIITGQSFDMSRSIVDIGWIPPLYFTALKCRVHRVRLQALRLIESASHREGIWDSKIAGCIARKVIEMEERDFYRDTETVDDFLLTSSPTLEDISLPNLPLPYRMNHVKVVLPDGPLENVFLLCRQKLSSGDWKVLSKEYNVLSECWTDVISGEEEDSEMWD